MSVIHITSKQDWEDRLKQAKTEGKLCIVDFHAQWCGPCKMIASVYEGLSRDNPHIYFLKVDVDEVSEVAEACDITAMPTFFIFKDGQRIDELVGASQDKLRALVAKYPAQQA